MKRFLAILLGLTAMLALFTVNTYADNKLEFEIVSDKANPERGDTIEIQIDVISNPGVRAISIDVSYDGAVLEFDKDNSEYCDLLPKGFGDIGNPKDGIVRIAGAVTKKNDTDITGTFATLKFKVKDDANFGASTIRIVRNEDDDCQNAAGDYIFYDEPTPSKVTVVCTHSNATFVAKNDATCTDEGNLAYYACPVCKKNFEDSEYTKEIEDVVIKALGHDMTKVDAVAATCDKEGNIEYWHCKRCEKNFLDEKGAEEATKITTDKVDHTPSDWETDEKDHWKVCTVCGQEIEGSRVAHTESKPAETAPTCTTNKILGSTHCEICNKNMTDGQEVEGTKLGHNMTEVPYKAPTCAEEGNEHYWHCDRCNKNFADNVEYTTNEIDEIVIPALGHNMTHHDAVAATCTAKGNVEYYYCDGCKKNFADVEGKTELTTIETEMIPHTESEWMTDAEGHWKECTVCHNIVVAKVKHTPGDPESHTAATCTEPERNGAVHCTECGYLISEGEELNPALGHDRVHHEYKDSTCTELGNNEYWECARCGKYYSDEACTAEITIESTIIQMKEHTYTEHAEDPADHHKAGVKKYYTCDVCGKVFDADKNETTLDALVIPQIPHDTITVWTSDDDNHWHLCSCGDKLDVAAHEEEVRDYQAPTCTEDGCEGGVYCKICNRLIKAGGNVIPALGHDLVEVPAVAATCTTDGNIQYWHCNTCGVNYADPEGKTVVNSVVVSKLGHDFKDGTCTRCGAEDPNYATYPSYVIVDDHYHATFDANHIMIYSVHTPSMFGVQSDGIYQWNICSVCGAAFNKTLINKTENPDDVTVNEGDQTEDIDIEEPVESNTPDEEEETTVVEEPTPVEDTNPKTGVTISLFAVVAAACAVALGKKR